MDCFLSWDLKSMMNISAEKLQKNISQQESFIDMYRADLIAESLKFNAAALLKYTLVNRSSLGTGDFERKATDALIVMLHATTFLKHAYFAPTDAENNNVAKCVKNLHRIMMENVKVTMKFIDYSILLRVASGELTEFNMYDARKKAYDEVFPCDDMLDVCDDEETNDQFYKLIDQENGKGCLMADFDASLTTTLSQEILQRLAGQTRRDEDLPESEYGIIKSAKSYLDTPFVRYGNSYYSFVTSYSLPSIAERIADLVPEKEETGQEPCPAEPTVEEPEASEQTVASEKESDVQFPEQEEISEELPPESESVSEKVPEKESEPAEEESPEENTVAEDDIPFGEPEEEPAPEPATSQSAAEEPMEEPEVGYTPVEQENTPASEENDKPEDSAMDMEAVEEEPVDGTEDDSESDDNLFDDTDDFEEIDHEEEHHTFEDSAYTETDEFEYPDEFEEDSSNSQEAIDEDNDSKEVYEDADYDQSDNGIQSDRIHEEYYDEEPYNALVSPDTYRYLEEAKPYEFTMDPMIEEQEAYEDEDFVTQEEETADLNDDDMYSSPSLFSIADESDVDEQEEKNEETPEAEAPNRHQCFPEDEEEPQPETEVLAAPEAEPAQEPVPEQVAEQGIETRHIDETGPETELEEESQSESESTSDKGFKSEHEATAEDLPLLELILKASPSKSNQIFLYLTGIDKSQQREIVRFIELARKNWLIDGKDKLFTIPETSISVAVFADNPDPMLTDQRRQNIGAVMYASHKDSWNSLEISYDEKGEVSKIDFNRISRSSFHDWEWKIVERMGNNIIERRGK